MSERRRITLFLGAFAAAILLVFAVHPQPLPQDLAYHCFADARTLIPGIPNTLNVLSNLGFLAVGVAWIASGGWRGARTAEVTFFLGITATAFGSAYYHLAPNNATLPWDRLGMAVAFMALLAILVEAHVTPRAPLAWLAALEVFGIVSVVLTGVTDDLRLYGIAQFFPIAVLLVLLAARRVAHPAPLWLAAAAYALAKIGEQFDGQIYDALGRTVSGHSLKHLAAAGGIAFIWRWLRSRRADPRGRSPRAGTSSASPASPPPGVRR